MKSKYLAAALLSSLPLFAHAQTSVTIYGVMDASIGVEDTDAPGEDSRTVVNSGNQSSSRIGFRGTEDLGNGLKALFNVEAGVALDTGAADSNLFNRRAVVGLQGAFGTLTVGREYSPIAAVAAATDILGQGFYGSNLSAFATNRLTRRLANSVNYKSDAMSGFTLNAAYSAGERATEPSGDVMGVSVEYKQGPIYLGAGYHNIERLATGDDKEWAVGAGFTAGAFELKANYLVGDQTGANNEYKNANIGGSFTAGPNKFFLNFQQQKIETGAKGNAVTLAYTYALSKRTNIYSTYAQLRNNARGVFNLQSAGTSIAPPATALGADPRVFNVGVRHTF